MTAEPTVHFTKQGPVARLTLHRPRVINAFNVQMRDDLFYALEAVRDDPDVKSILISGSGDRGFCAGADLTEFGSAPSQAVARQVRWERDIWGLFLRIPKPKVAALHGYVIGSGVEIACLCDIRLASDDAIFRMPESALSMVPAAGGSQTIPRTIGLGPAMNMLMSNQVLDASAALDLGLVHRVVPPEDLTDAATQVAERLARAPAAASAIKRAISEGMDTTLSHGLALEDRLAKEPRHTQLVPRCRPGVHKTQAGGVHTRTNGCVALTTRLKAGLDYR